MISNSPPKYVSPNNFDSVPIAPPFYFESVQTRVLPLRARVGPLQHLIDRYANFVPPQVGRFRVATPYVFLMILDYGKLALEAANIGWLGQKEFMFAVPTNHYTLAGHRWVFQGMKWFSPFIFVDSDISLTLGRRTYGWPKLRIYDEPLRSVWADAADSATPRLTLCADAYTQTYAGETLDRHVLCEVVQLEDRSFDIPFRVDAGLRPWTLAREAADFSLGLGRDYLRSLDLQRSTPARPDVFFAQAMKFASSMNPANPDAIFEVVNLKQFRAIASPDQYCYQSLTVAPMRFTTVNGIGPLTDPNLTNLSASGGLRVRLHNLPSHPIVEKLGLEVSQVWRSGAVEIHELKPVLPFWYNANMVYERGRNLAERSHTGTWHTPRGCYERRPAVESEEDKLFNITLGSAGQAISGPFVSTSTHLRVLPLLAKKREVEDFVEEYLNTPLSTPTEKNNVKFELWSGDESLSAGYAYVYLVIGSVDKLYSTTDDIGNWAGKDATYYIPVKVTIDEKTTRFGLVQATSFVSSTARAISVTELYGPPTRVATFEAPPTTWFESADEYFQDAVLTLRSEVLPSVGRGQEADERDVMTIRTHRTTDDPDFHERLLRDWAPRLRVQADAKATWCFGAQPEVDHPPRQGTRSRAREHAIALLTGFETFDVYTLKQIRDGENPHRACYQSLNRLPRRIDHTYRIERLPSTLRLQIREFESQPLVQLLGLHATLSTNEDTNEHWYTLLPVSPFWLRVALTSEKGECVVYRSRDTNWRWTRREQSDDNSRSEKGPTKAHKAAAQRADIGRELHLDEVPQLPKQFELPLWDRIELDASSGEFREFLLRLVSLEESFRNDDPNQLRDKVVASVRKRIQRAEFHRLSQLLYSDPDPDFFKQHPSSLATLASGSGPGKPEPLAGLEATLTNLVDWFTLCFDHPYVRLYAGGKDPTFGDLDEEPGKALETIQSTSKHMLGQLRESLEQIVVLVESEDLRHERAETIRKLVERLHTNLDKLKPDKVTEKITEKMRQAATYGETKFPEKLEQVRKRDDRTGRLSSFTKLLLELDSQGADVADLLDAAQTDSSTTLTLDQSCEELMKSVYHVYLLRLRSRSKDFAVWLALVIAEVITVLEEGSLKDRIHDAAASEEDFDTSRIVELIISNDFSVLHTEPHQAQACVAAIYDFVADNLILNLAYFRHLTHAMMPFAGAKDLRCPAILLRRFKTLPTTPDPAAHGNVRPGLEMSLSPQAVIEDILHRGWASTDVKLARARSTTSARLRTRELLSGRTAMASVEFFREEIRYRLKDRLRRPASRATIALCDAALRRLSIYAGLFDSLSELARGFDEGAWRGGLAGAVNKAGQRFYDNLLRHKKEPPQPDELLAIGTTLETLRLCGETIAAAKSDTKRTKELFSEALVSAERTLGIQTRVVKGALARFDLGPKFFVDLELFDDTADYFPPEHCHDGRYMGQIAKPPTGAAG